MDKELYSTGELNIKIESGKVIVSLDTKGVDVAVSLDGDYFLDKLKEAIPGKVDDAVIDIIKAALKV